MTKIKIQDELHKREIRKHTFSVMLKIFEETVTQERVGKIADYVKLDGNGCWVCSGGISHRYFYETLVGPIPTKGPRYDVIQTCGNRKCVNPDHLAAVPSGLNPLRIAGVAESSKRKQEKREAESLEKKLQERYNRKTHCDVCQARMTTYNTLPGGRCRKCVNAEVKAAVKAKKEEARAEREAKLTRAKEWLAAQDAAMEQEAASGDESDTTRAVAPQASENGAAAMSLAAPVAVSVSDQEPAIEWPVELMSEV